MSVDSRIVTMKFDNKQFEQEAGKTIGTLDKLKAGLKLEGAGKGLADVQGAINKVDFGPMEGGITSISKGFVAMSTIAITALSNITNRAVDAGLTMAKSLTIDPVAAGFSEYEMKLGAIQTIMAGSGESLDVVNQKLQELNTYSDQTIYSFSDMTQNIGKFTNAGVSLEDSVAAIKGVANVAALSGANAEEAARSMYNFAQSLSSGAVRLADWKSIELANMATVEFKTELLESAVAAGTLERAGEGMYHVIGTKAGETISATKGFNDSLQEEWLTAEALTSTLGRYADATTDIGKRATAAATEVKTFSQLMDTLKEGVGSGWATTFEIIVGDFEEAKALWTNVNNVVGGMIQKSAEARNAMLTEWKAMGGRDVLLEGLTNIVHAVANIINPIKDAFREIFPPKTAQQIYDMTVAFRDFTQHLVIQPEIMDAIKSVAKGLFSIFSIIHQFGRLGWKILIAVFDALTTGTGAASGGILQFLAKIADVISAFDAWLKEGDRLKNFLDKIAGYITKPIKLIGEFAAAIFGLARGDTTPFLENMMTKFEALGPVVQKVSDKFQSLRELISRFTGAFDEFFNFGEDATASVSVIGSVNNALETTSTTMDTLARVWDAVVRSFQATKDFLSPLLDKIWAGIKRFKDNFMTFIDSISMLDIIAVGAGGGAISFFLSLRKIMKNFSGLLEKVGGAFEGIGGVLDQTTKNLKAMQQDVKATAILKIAAALALLAVALWVLSKIPADKLAWSLGTVVTTLAALTGAMYVLNKWVGDGVKDSIKLAIIAGSIVLLSVAILILAAAVAVFGNMETGTLIQGVLTIFAILAALVGVSKLFDMAGGEKSFAKVAASLIVLSVGLMALVGAIKLFDSLSAGTLTQGLGLIAGIILGLVGLAALLEETKGTKKLLRMAASLLVLAIALDAFATSLLIYDQLDATTVLDSLWKIGLIIGGLIGASKLLGKKGAKGLLELSAALLVFGFALSVMVPPLILLGKMTWSEVLAALTMLGVGLVILGLVARTLGGAIIIFLWGFASASALFGLAMLSVGAGMLMFSAGLASLAISGAAGAAVIIAFIIALIKLIPMMAIELAKGFVAFFEVLGQEAPRVKDAFVSIFSNMMQGVIELAPQFGEMMTALITSMLQSIIDSAPKFFEALTVILEGLCQLIIDTAPKFGEAITVVVETFIQVVRDLFPDLVDLGFDMLMEILEGIRDNIREITETALEIIAEFIRGIGDGADDLADAGMDALVDIINGFADAIETHSHDINVATKRLADAIVNGLIDGLETMGGPLGRIGAWVARKVIGGAEDEAEVQSPSRVFMRMGEYMGEGLVIGLDGYSSTLYNAGSNMGESAIDGIKSTISQIPDVMPDDVNLNPVIAPVLDLTQVKKKATDLDAIFGTTPISVIDSYAKATQLAAAEFTKPKELNPEGQTSTLVNFEQNNYSPKALSSVEIYRQTKNQLSLAKEALKA